jgi:hypothetical protein
MEAQGPAARRRVVSVREGGRRDGGEREEGWEGAEGRGAGGAGAYCAMSAL